MNDPSFSRKLVSPAASGAEAREVPMTAFGVRNSAMPILMQYLRIAIRRKWVLAGAVGIAVVLGLIATLLMTPLYTASTTIEISRESDRVVDIKGVEAESSPGDIEFYQTQYGLLRSQSLADRVVRELKLADDSKFFELFGEEKASGLFGVDAGARNTPAGREKRSREAARILLENIDIVPDRLSRLVTITFTSPDPKLSARVANAWTANFIESNLERRFEATSYARKFLEERLRQWRERLEESERVLVAYASDEKIINLPAAGATRDGPTVERSIVADDLASLNAELSAAKGEMVRAHSRVTEVGANGAVEEALTNNAITGIRQKRAEVAAEYARLLSQFEPEYPEVKALATQLSQLDRSIASEENRIRTSLQQSYQASVARVGDLEGRVSNLKSSFLDLRRRSIQYNIYQREADTNRQLYDALLQRYKEIGVAGGVGTNNVSVVDVARIPERPSRPSLILNMLAALILGAGIGAALAFALEHIDEAISDPQEIADLLGLPVLGIVPKAATESPIEALGDRKSPMVEAYLSVQTNLAFSTNHGVPKTLSVTSTRPAEGKSTTAYAIAHALARSKQKVVLIDADMRSPSVHHLFSIGNERGLSNYLAGSEQLDELISSSSLAGLSIITAGPQPPNAAELLTGQRLEQLLTALLTRFDHVVVDSPPVMGLADAPLIASRVEGVVFAVESHGIKASMVRVALGRLAAANAHVLGTVLTKFESKRSYFGYGYDYGYGYGQTSKAES